MQLSCRDASGSAARSSAAIARRARARRADAHANRRRAPDSARPSRVTTADPAVPPRISSSSCVARSIARSCSSRIDAALEALRRVRDQGQSDGRARPLHRARRTRLRRAHRVVSSPMPESSPPMMPARPSGLRSSAITRTSGVSSISRPSSSLSFSPAARKAHIDRAVQLAAGRRRAAADRARASRSSSRRRRR